MTIEFNIDKLVLHGFADADRYMIADALQLELARLVAEQGLPVRAGESGDISRLDSGAFDVASNSKPGLVGTQVAQAVYKGLSQ
jgi:hypothetical protein